MLGCIRRDISLIVIYLQQLEEGVSFVWSGLWQAKEELKLGFRWVLGDGERTRVYEDMWLRGKDNFRVDITPTGNSGVTKVYDLFIPGTKQRDVQKVSSLFLNYDAEVILAMPVLQIRLRIVLLGLMLRMEGIV